MGEETSQAQTLFVGGLPNDATMEEVKGYFQQFGEVDVDIKFDQQTGRSRGFGFLAFVDPASVEPCLAQAASHQIREKWVDVKIYNKGGGKGGKDKGKGKGFDKGKGKGKPAYGGGGYGGGGGYQSSYGKGQPAYGGGGYDPYGGAAAAYGGAAAGGAYAGYGGGYAAQPQAQYQQQSYGGYGQQQMRYSPY